MGKRPPRTVLELCVGRQGGGFADVRRGMVTCTRLILWAIVAAELGQFPTAEQYGEYWLLSERTIWRHRHSIREVFSEDEMRELVALLVEAGAQRSADRGELMKVDVPADLGIAAA